MSWKDYDVVINTSWSPDDSYLWYKLPKVGDIVGLITVTTKGTCLVQLLVAGEHRWSSMVESHCIIPITLNMMKLGDHAAIIQVHANPNDVKVNARYRVFTNDIIRKTVAEARVASEKWYELKAPEEWNIAV